MRLAETGLPLDHDLDILVERGENWGHLDLRARRRRTGFRSLSKMRRVLQGKLGRVGDSERSDGRPGPA